MIIFSTGLFFYLKFEQNEIRKEVKHLILDGMDRNDLIEFTFSWEEAQNLSWKHSREFSLNGHFYDVVQSEFKNGRVHYYCWLDDKEAQVNKAMNNFIFNILGTSNQSKKKEFQLNWLKLTLFLNSNEIKETSQNYSDFIGFHHLDFYKSQYLTPATPPPIYC